MIFHPLERKPYQFSYCFYQFNIMLAIFCTFFEVIPGRCRIKWCMYIKILMCFFCSREKRINFTIFDCLQFFPFYPEYNCRCFRICICKKQIICIFCSGLFRASIRYRRVHTQSKYVICICFFI